MAMSVKSIPNRYMIHCFTWWWCRRISFFRSTEQTKLITFCSYVLVPILLSLYLLLFYINRNSTNPNKLNLINHINWTPTLLVCVMPMGVGLPCGAVPPVGIIQISRSFPIRLWMLLVLVVYRVFGCMLRFSSPWNIVDFRAPLFASCWVGIGLSHDDTSLVLVHVIEKKSPSDHPGTIWRCI